MLDAAGEPATGWTLVTGDAESTDTDEWMVFQSNLSRTVLPNNGAPETPTAMPATTRTTRQLRLPGVHGPDAPASEPTVTSPPTSNYLGSLISSVKGRPPPAAGYTSVLCESDQQLNKTGTMMLSAQEPGTSSAAQTLTVTMRGAGLEAMFLGVLL